jgi:hypothetical protein
LIIVPVELANIVFVKHKGHLVTILTARLKNKTQTNPQIKNHSKKP